LNSAGISGSNEIVTFLIKSGAEVNAQFDSGGRYVLSHLCHFAPLPETIALLLQAGANPNCVDDTGTSPLVVTAFSREDAIGVEIMKHLVKHGARVDTKDCEGRTALDVAAERGHLLQVAFLKRDNQGITRRIFGSLFD
jgi:ankyrin repeat protein